MPLTLMTGPHATVTYKHVFGDLDVHFLFICVWIELEDVCYINYYTVLPTERGTPTVLLKTFPHLKWELMINYLYLAFSK